MDRGRRLGSTDGSKIAEYFAATGLMAASDGRLSPYVPLADDHGIDLIVFDKETGRSVAVQVKSWLADASGARRTVQFDVRKTTYRRVGTVLLALVLNPASMSLEAAWLIPMSEVPGVSVEYTGKYALSPSRAAGSRDRYSGCRHADFASVAAELIRVMAASPS